MNGGGWALAIELLCLYSFGWCLLCSRFLDRAHRFSDDAHGDEIILRLALRDDFNDLPGLLIECLHRCQNISAGQSLRLAEYSLGAVLIDVKAKNLPAELGESQSSYPPPRGLRHLLRLSDHSCREATQPSSKYSNLQKETLLHLNLAHRSSPWIQKLGI